MDNNDELNLLARIESLEKHIDESAFKILNLEKDCIISKGAESEISTKAGQTGYQTVFEQYEQNLEEDHNLNCYEEIQNYENCHLNQKSPAEAEEIIEQTQNYAHQYQNQANLYDSNENQYENRRNVDLEAINEEAEPEKKSEDKEANKEEVRLSKLSESEAEAVYNERMKNLMNKFQKSQTKMSVSQEGQSVNKNTKNSSSKKSLRKRNEKSSFGITNTNETESYKNTDASRMKASTKSIDRNNENIQKETTTCNNNDKSKNYYGVQLYYQGLEKIEERRKFIEYKKRMIEEERLRECTFTPAPFLTAKAKNMKEYEHILVKAKKIEERKLEREKQHEIDQMHKEFENCTFSPSINRKSKKFTKSSSVQDFFKKQIDWRKKVDIKNMMSKNSSHQRLMNNASATTSSFSSKERKSKKIYNKSISINSQTSSRTEFSNGKISKILTDYVQKTKENEENYIYYPSPKRSNKKMHTMNNNKAPIAKEINETINIFKNIRNQLSVSKDLSLSISFENYKDFGCFSSTKKSSAAKKLKTVPNQQLKVEKLDFFEKKPLMLEDKFNKILEKANNISKKIKRLY